MSFFDAKVVLANAVAGFVFVPFLDDRFFQFLAVALPTGIGFAVSVLTGYSKIRNLLVDEVTKSVMKEVRKELDETNAALAKAVRKEIQSDREKVIEQIGDELWGRVEVLAAAKVDAKIRSQRRSETQVQSKSNVDHEIQFDAQAG